MSIWPRVRLISHNINLGYGAALRTGFEAARYDLVAFTDADSQFHLEDIEDLVCLAREVPVVVGWRVDRQDPWRRRFLSRGYNWLARTLLGTGVRDCDCALKVFRRETLAYLLPESTGFFVNTEMLCRARTMRLDGGRSRRAPPSAEPRAEQGLADGSAEDVCEDDALLVAAHPVVEAVRGAGGQQAGRFAVSQRRGPRRRSAGRRESAGEPGRVSAGSVGTHTALPCLTRPGLAGC